MKLKRAAFNPAAVARETVALLGESGVKKNVPISLELGPGVDGEFVGDASKITQVLINLVGNAVKFTSEGKIDVRVSQLRDGGQTSVRFEVADTGPGIPAQSLSTIFEEFAQVDQSLSRQHGGTGLGLAICQQFVTLMGGEIGVESELGKGSKFHFQVPMGDV